MSSMEDRLRRLEFRFHYTFVTAFLFVLAIALFGGTTIYNIPETTAELADNYLSGEKFNGIVEGLVKDFSEREVDIILTSSLDLEPGTPIFKTGTIHADEWKRLSSGGTYGVEADVNVDLSNIHSPRIFLSRRGKSHIWETQGLAAYPLGGYEDEAGEWDGGFRAIIHAGDLRRRKQDKQILTLAQNYGWEVDWFVIGEAVPAEDSENSP